jgi:SNARE associated Golgi protein
VCIDTSEIRVICIFIFRSSYTILRCTFWETLYQSALAHNGFKIVVLMRLSPLVPNHILDYVSGITSIRIIDYTLASIGIIPSTVAFCYAGATASSISEGEENLHATNHKINTLILVVGLFFAVSGIVLISYYAKKELDEMLPSHISIEQQLQDDNNSYQPYHGSNPIGHANHTNTQQMYPASHLSSPRSITPTLQSLV